MRDPSPISSGYLAHAEARRIIVGVLITMLLAALDQVMVATALPTIADVASPRDRPRYQAYTSSTFIISTVAGPLVGGFIAQYFHWSWIFWMNLPLCALAYFFSHTVLQRLPRHERPHELDLLGAVLMIGAAIPLILALTWGGRRYAWSSPELLGLLAFSALLWALFAWRAMTAREPFIPVSVLRDSAIRAGTIAGCFAVGMMIALTVFMPLY